MDQYSKKRNISQADPHMISRRTFDEDCDAQRVILVSGELPTFNMPEIIFPELKQQDIKVIEVPTTTIVKEIQVVEIEKQVIVKEYEKIEVPVYIEKIVEVVREIQVPVVHTKIEFVEKPVIIKETVSSITDLPNYLKICVLVQALATIVLLVKSILK